VFRQRPSSEIPAAANDSFEVLAEPIKFDGKEAQIQYLSRRRVSRSSLGLFVINNAPCIHVVVDEWIDHCIAHGQPVESEEDVLHVLVRSDIAIDKLVDKVAVIGKPTHCEQQDDYDKHLHHLLHKKMHKKKKKKKKKEYLKRSFHLYRLLKLSREAQNCLATSRSG